MISEFHTDDRDGQLRGGHGYTPTLAARVYLELFVWAMVLLRLACEVVYGVRAGVVWLARTRRRAEVRAAAHVPPVWIVRAGLARDSDGIDEDFI